MKLSDKKVVALRGVWPKHLIDALDRLEQQNRSGYYAWWNEPPEMWHDHQKELWDTLTEMQDRMLHDFIVVVEGTKK